MLTTGSFDGLTTSVAPAGLTVLPSSFSGYGVSRHFRNHTNKPTSSAAPTTPPTVPPMIAFLLIFFGGEDAVLAEVGIAVALDKAERLLEVDATDEEVANCTTVGVKLWPTWPGKEVSAV